MTRIFHALPGGSLTSRSNQMVDRIAEPVRRQTTRLQGSTGHGPRRLFSVRDGARCFYQAFPRPDLQPTDPRQLAHMTQICAILDNYSWAPMALSFQSKAASRVVRLSRMPCPRRSSHSRPSSGWQRAVTFYVARRSASQICTSSQSSITSPGPTTEKPH